VALFRLDFRSLSILMLLLPSTRSLFIPTFNMSCAPSSWHATARRDGEWNARWECAIGIANPKADELHERESDACKCCCGNLNFHNVVFSYFAPNESRDKSSPSSPESLFSFFFFFLSSSFGHFLSFFTF